MNKRQLQKRNKTQWALFIEKNAWYNEMKEDSVAHLIKSYFTLGTIRNLELFRTNIENKKILVSKKALNHILRLCENELLEQNFDFELVEEIKIIKEEEDGNK